MAQVIIDASALVEVFTGCSPDPELRRTVLVHDLAAPELIDVEVLNVLRKLLRRGLLTDAHADRTAHWLADAPITRIPHRGLTARIWELRHSIAAYDAAYVALAEQLDAPLVTCDARLGTANGHKASIEVYSTN